MRIKVTSPSVRYHSLDQASAALAAAGPRGELVDLVTTPGAARFAGPSYLLTAFERARDGHPSAKATAWLDCGEDAGLVWRAIKVGWRHVVFTGRKTVTERLEDICAQHHVEIRSHRAFH
jgi:hypothetical protein